MKNHLKIMPEGLRVWRGRARLTQVERDSLFVTGVWAAMALLLVVVTEVLTS